MENTEVVKLSEEDIKTFIKDPALIPSHEIVIQLLSILDQEISGIQVQIDAYAIAAARVAPSETSIDWAKRASFAMNIKRKQRDRVFKRDRELRGIYTQTQKKDPEEGLFKQKRLADEIAIRRIRAETDRMKAQTELSSVANKRQIGILFMDLVREQLGQDVYQSIYDQAVALRKATADKTHENKVSNQIISKKQSIKITTDSSKTIDQQLLEIHGDDNCNCGFKKRLSGDLGCSYPHGRIPEMADDQNIFKGFSSWVFPEEKIEIIINTIPHGLKVNLGLSCNDFIYEHRKYYNLDINHPWQLKGNDGTIAEPFWTISKLREHGLPFYLNLNVGHGD